MSEVPEHACTHVTCICLISTMAPGKCCKTVRTRWKTLDLKSEDLDLILLLTKLLGLGFFLYQKDYTYLTGLL